MLWHIELKFCILLCFTLLQIKFECCQFPSIFVGVLPLLELKILEIHSFPHFSLTCFDISKLKFCIWLCFTVLQIKFQWRQFPSMFDGVIPLLELRILKIHSFPYFSLTRFDILSWNFAYEFLLLYYRLSLSVLNLHLFLWELCPFWNLECWKYTVFCTFLLRALTNWAETLHMTLFNVQKIKFECHNSVSVWLSVRLSIFCIFLLHTSTYLAENQKFTFTWFL